MNGRAGQNVQVVLNRQVDVTANNTASLTFMLVNGNTVRPDHED